MSALATAWFIMRVMAWMGVIAFGALAGLALLLRASSAFGWWRLRRRAARHAKRAEREAAERWKAPAP